MIERTTIAFFGRTNAGKSSLINALTSQEVSIVSEIRGTTTDPVKKVMELLPIGPVTIVDTPGFDDTTELAVERIKRTVQVLNSTQLAVVVLDGSYTELSDGEKNIILELQKRKIPFIVAVNKCDSYESSNIQQSCSKLNIPQDCILEVSARNNTNINELKNKLGELYKSRQSIHNRPLIKDLVNSGEIVVLVIPIDEAAPRDRIILPQQMVLRELLEYGAIPVCCTPQTLGQTLKGLKNKPGLVVTDSQAFGEVNKILSQNIRLTSFSILMARYKGTLKDSLGAIKQLNSLKTGEKVLISEGCTHHRQCGDIGTVKMPAAIKKLCGTEPIFDFSSGSTFPEDLSCYKIVVHCGGCMLNENEMKGRAKRAKEQKVPFTNYGMVLAQANGILERSMKVFDTALDRE